MTSVDKGVLFGRYLLGQRLAVGGMGEGYRAVQTGLGSFEKPLALKLLLPHLAEEPRFVKMFLDEASLAARMGHPNVVQILDVGVEQGTYFLAMELVRGASLSVLIKNLAAAQERASPQLCVYVARALCDGLHHAHEQRAPTGEPMELVHRDVNPQNVLLSMNGEVKLADFGIAKARATQEEDPTRVRGKLEYLAPEQLGSPNVDRRADLFGLGVTLYQLATAVSPFRRATIEETRAAILTEEPLSLSAARPDLPEAFCAAVQRALAKNRDSRFATARAMRDALPAATPEAAEELSRLVEKHCQETVSRIEQQATEVLTLGRNTTAATGTGALTVSKTVPPAPLRASRLAALVAGVVALAAVGFWLRARPGTSTALAAPLPAVPTAALAPSPPSMAPAPPAPAPAPAPKRIVAHPTPAPVSRQEVGYLNIDAEPWALVSVAGKRVGETPIARYPVARGDVSVEFENPENGKRITRRVKVTAGQEANVRGDVR